MAHPATILSTLMSVCIAAKVVCDEIDKALELELELEARRALNELRQGIKSLKSDTMGYKDLLSATEKVTDLEEGSPYTQLYVMGLRSILKYSQSQYFAISQIGRCGCNGGL